ncbi:membrane protein [Microlunatus endophyticus]|uniref:Membrane protein n=1 Tax=Microlunatus endophyticus TaxID=1716077 RepID=A0A917S5P7_9ACTN|nr:FUSC family protein [Microlunatus endophyticus]GGL59934.1 membrane protein [Microlunatus endophyticus]
MSAGIAPQTPAMQPVRQIQPPYEWWERFVASDPGLTRLRTAGQAVASIGAAMLAEWLLARTTGQTDHAATVIAMMVGAVVGMISTFVGPMFQRPLAVLASLALVPVPMIGGMALGLALAPFHVAALASLVVVLAAGAYLRRFGPRGFFGGQLLFMGDFFGFFLGRLMTIADLGQLALIVIVGTAVAIIAQFTLFYPSRRTALRRLRRSFVGRVSQVADAAIDLLDDPGDKQRSRLLQKLLIRLNECALMVDAQLADQAALPRGATAAALHQRVFDSELTLTNTARFAERLSDPEVPADLRALVRQALIAVRDRDPDGAKEAANAIRTRLKETGPADGADESKRLDQTIRIVLHRFTTSVIGHAEVMRMIRDHPEPSDIPDDSDNPFDPAVTLAGGWLPGSQKVSATASTEAGARWIDRVKLEPYARVTIQMAVAVTGSIIVGSLVSPQRFYWAVIATFVTFMGAHNATEQIRKSAYRVLGTLIGVVVGVVLAHLIGDHTRMSIMVILVALFFGIYLLRVSYAFMVIGITVMMAQLYVQLNEFTDALLLLRLAETAIGAAIASLTVLFVLPVRIRQVVAVATREHLQALDEVAGLAIERLREPGSDSDLRAAARRLDAAYQALEAATRPLRGRLPGVGGGGLREQFWYAATSSRHYARNLVIDTGWSSCLPEELGVELQTAGKLLSNSIKEIIEAFEEQSFTDRTYMRSAALFDRIASGLDDEDVTTPRQLAFRDLELIDGSLATLAQSLGIQVEALDTSRVSP